MLGLEHSALGAPADHWQRGSRFVALADQKPHLEQSGDDGVHSVFQISEIIIDAVEHWCLCVLVSYIFRLVNNKTDHKLIVEVRVQFQLEMPSQSKIISFHILRT